MFRPIYTFLLALLLITGCTESKKEKRQKQVEDLQQQLSSTDPEDKTLQDSLALALSDAYEEYAEKFPEDTTSAKYLFQASNLNYQRLGRASKAMDLARKVYHEYPESSKAPEALFMSAFLQEEQKNFEESQQLFKLFLERYPDHHFADDAQFSMDMMGKDESEVLDRLHLMGRDTLQNIP